MNSRGRRTQRRAQERRAANARRLELLPIQQSYRPKRKKRKIKNKKSTPAGGGSTPATTAPG